MLNFTIKMLQEIQRDKQNKNIRIKHNSKPIIMKESVNNETHTYDVGRVYEIYVLHIHKGMEDKARLLGYELEEEIDDK